MAEAGVLERNILCRYYLHGVCKQGNECLYKHDLQAKPSLVCKYYLQGSCTFGDNCRYDHVKPKDKNQTKPLKNQTRAVGPPSLGEGSNKNQNVISHMTKLNKKKTYETLEEDIEKNNEKLPNNWVQAEEFVPGQIWKGSGPFSYSDAALKGVDNPEVVDPDPGGSGTGDVEKVEELCPYAAQGQCWYGENCTYIHGDPCDLCGRQVLHPTDEEQRKDHNEQCIRQHEENMELSFAIARSKEKVCGICMDIVMDKKPTSEARFGILSNCTHVFCLPCIRKWRQAKQFENKIIRACPECRVKSDFVTPSRFWIDDEEEKSKLITDYKSALSQKPCKYFDKGKGECPFNNNCFYLHAYPDGRLASPKPVRRRRRQNADADSDTIQPSMLWEFLEEHRRRLVELSLDLQDEFEVLLLQAGVWDSDDEDSLLDFDGYL